MGLDSVWNFVQVQASTGYSSSATTVSLQSGQGSKLLAAPFNLIWWDSRDYPNPANDPNVEIVRVTNVSSDTIIVTRAQEGTSAASPTSSTSRKRAGHPSLPKCAPPAQPEYPAASLPALTALKWGMPELTRRRYPERPDCWHVYYGDVHAGTIAMRVGIPHERRSVGMVGRLLSG
jgi:hypothetical protein